MPFVLSQIRERKILLLWDSVKLWLLTEEKKEAEKTFNSLNTHRWLEKRLRHLKASRHLNISSHYFSINHFRFLLVFSSFTPYSKTRNQKETEFLSGIVERKKSIFFWSCRRSSINIWVLRRQYSIFKFTNAMLINNICFFLKSFSDLVLLRFFLLLAEKQERVWSEVASKKKVKIARISQRTRE